MRPPRRTRRVRPDLILLAGLLLLLSVAERRAERLREWTRNDVIEALAARNSDLGKSFVSFADWHAAEGRYRKAFRWYRQSSEQEGDEGVAAARIDRLRKEVKAKTRRDSLDDPGERG